MPREKRVINWEIVEKRMEAGCTAKEISACLCVDTDTFYSRVKEHFGKGFADISAEFYSAGDANIKFTQYMKALSGNIPMLHLLGRERLNQGKEPEQKSPYEDITILRHENMILRAENVEFKEKESQINERIN